MTFCAPEPRTRDIQSPRHLQDFTRAQNCRTYGFNLAFKSCDVNTANPLAVYRLNLRHVQNEKLAFVLSDNEPNRPWSDGGTLRRLGEPPKKVSASGSDSVTRTRRLFYIYIRISVAGLVRACRVLASFSFGEFVSGLLLARFA